MGPGQPPLEPPCLEDSSLQPPAVAQNPHEAVPLHLAFSFLVPTSPCPLIHFGTHPSGSVPGTLSGGTRSAKVSQGSITSGCTGMFPRHDRSL